MAEFLRMFTVCFFFGADAGLMLMGFPILGLILLVPITIGAFIESEHYHRRRRKKLHEMQLESYKALMRDQR